MFKPKENVQMSKVGNVLYTPAVHRWHDWLPAWPGRDDFTVVVTCAGN